MDPLPMAKLLVPRAVRKTPIFTPYVIAWTMMGMFSIGYLSIAALAPDWLDDLTPASLSIDPSTNQGQRANARLAAELSGVRDSIAQIQLDLSRIKTEVTASAERERGYASQLAAVERRIDAGGQVQAAATPDMSGPATADATGTGSSEKSKTSAATAATPPAQPTVINGDKLDASRLVTGSVTTTPANDKPISFGPAIVKPAAKPVGLQISKGASVDSLRLSWSLLSERHGDVLKNLEPRFTAGGDAGAPSFDLVAGPLKSKAEAMRACKALAAKNVACQVTDYTGDAL